MRVLSGLTPVSRLILIGNGIASLGSGLTFSFIVIYLGQVRGLGVTAAGLLVAYMAVLGLICTLASGSLVDRFGPRPVLMVGLGIVTVAIASLTLVDSLPSAVIVTTILAVGNAGYWAPQSALYARVTAREHRQDVFGLQFMVINLGLGLGGLVAATIVDVDRPQTFVVLYLIDAATSVIYLLLLATLRGVGVGPSRDEDEPAPADGGYRVVLRDRTLMSLALAAVVLLTFGYGSMDVGLPTYATVIGGLPVSTVAIAWAVNTAVIVVVQLAVLRLIRQRSRTRLAALVAVLWALAWVCIGVAIVFPPLTATAVICLGTAVFGLGEAIWSPIGPALVNDLAREDLRGRYNAVIGWTWNVSSAIGPAFAGVMLGADLVVGWLGAIVLGCGVAGVLMLRLRRRLTPAQDRPVG